MQRLKDVDKKSMIRGTISLYEKIYGCLAGFALGDTMGRPVEGWDYQEIEKKYGKITDLLLDVPTRFNRYQASRIGTEHTTLARLLCKSYLEKEGRITTEDWAKTWLEAEEMEKCTLFLAGQSSYELLKKGIPPRLAGFLNYVDRESLMVVAPIGIFNACDPDQAYIDAIEIVSMYQRDEGVDAAAVLASSIAEAMRPDTTVNSIIEAGLKRASSKKYLKFFQRDIDNLKEALETSLEIAKKYNDIFRIREELYQNVLQPKNREAFMDTMLDPIEICSLVFALFQVAKGEPRKAIIAGVNIGRSANTIASLLGALSGALNGIKSLPLNWVNFLEKCDQFHLTEEREKIEDISKRMVSLVEKEDDTSKERIKLLEKSGVGKEPIEESLIHQKIYGCLLGGALGDTMGRPVEGMNYREI